MGRAWLAPPTELRNPFRGSAGENTMTDEKRFYGILGEDYDQFKLAVPHHDELQNEVARSVTSFGENNAGLRTITVLEIGCGHGETTRRILDADPRVRVIAVDNDQKMLKAARERLKDYGTRVRFKSDLFEAFKGPKGEDPWIDVIASAYTLHNFPRDYRLAVAERIFKNLRKPGIYVNADKYAQQDPIAHWEDLKKQIDVFSVFDDIGRRDLRVEWTKHYIEDEQTKWTVEEESALFYEAGFYTADIKGGKRGRKGMEAVFYARWY